MFTNLTDSVFSLIYPTKCSVCGCDVGRYSDGNACEACWNETRFFSGNEDLCQKCGALLESPRGGSPAACGDCRDHLYDNAFAVGVYEKALAAAIVSLKMQPHIPKRLVELVGVACARRIRNTGLIVVSVPLSKRRLKERGHNQAAVIADTVGAVTGCRVEQNVIARISHTQMHRGLMDRKAREMSVLKAFDVVKPRLVADAEILLVDDVLTTGATVSACSDALKKAGAASVTVFTLARAVKRF